MNKTEALIVDDSMSARFALNRSLQPYELNVSTAKTAEEAIETVAQTRFDVIFMDHVLPGKNGLEAVEEIRTLPGYAGTPIIMCTSNDSSDYITEAMERGATAVMHKPPDNDALAQLIQIHVLQRHELQESVAEELPVETLSMNDTDKLKAIDERLDRLEAMLQRLEGSIGQMDARTQAAARVIANHAGQALANRLLKAMMILKGK